MRPSTLSVSQLLTFSTWIPIGAEVVSAMSGTLPVLRPTGIGLPVTWGS